MIQRPLYEVADALTPACGVRLTVAKELREQKTVILVQDRPAGVILARLAQTFGGQWVSDVSSGTEILRLELLPDVQKWLARRERARQESLRYAQQIAADAFKKAVREHFDHTEDDTWMHPGSYDRDACRFLKTLPPEFLDRAAQQVGQSTAVSSIARMSNSGMYATRFSLSELGPEQQQAFSNWVSKMPDGPPKAGLLKHYPNLTIALGSNDGIALSVGIRGPDAPDGMPTFQMGIPATGGGGLSNDKIEELRKAEFKRLMVPFPTPPEAFLGTNVSPDGDATEKVVVSQDALRKRGWTPHSGSPLPYEICGQLAENQQFDIVADYYTLSQRLTTRPNNLGELFDRAATTFHIIIREQDNFLMVRHLDYPDLDRVEIPYPFAEDWINRKQKVISGRNAPLKVEQLFEMAARTPEELASLIRYNDPDTGVRFNEAEWLMEQNYNDYEGRPNLYWVNLLIRLKPELRTQLLSPEGVPLKSLPRDVQNMVTGQTRWRLKGKPLPSGGYLAMQTIFPSEDEKEQPFTLLRVVWPKEREKNKPLIVTDFPAMIAESSEVKKP